MARDAASRACCNLGVIDSAQVTADRADRIALCDFVVGLECDTSGARNIVR